MEKLIKDFERLEKQLEALEGLIELSSENILPDNTLKKLGIKTKKKVRKTQKSKIKKRSSPLKLN